MPVARSGAGRDNGAVHAPLAGVCRPGAQGQGRDTLEHRRELEAFLAGVERRAFIKAKLATGDREEALDLLQDAMMLLVRKYAGRDAQEWGPLFATILQRRISDWYRRNAVRRRWRGWLGRNPGDGGEDEDALAQVADARGRSPEQMTQADRRIDALEVALRALPMRQQQVFLLRNWEGYDVKQTAGIMGCSEGSVKTHYSRAVHTLREKLGAHW